MPCRVDLGRVISGSDEIGLTSFGLGLGMVRVIQSIPFGLDQFCQF